MARKNMNAQAAEEIVVAAVETVEAIETIEAAPAGPATMILFTASRGKNTRLGWAAIEVGAEDELVKVRGVAAELPVQVAEAIGADKFVAYVDLAVIERCVEEGKAVRGTASTVSDVYNRYIKVTDTVGERVPVALAVFGEIIEAVGAGIANGEWVRPEPEVEEAAPEAEGGTEEPAA